jgi:hypothetical protein
VVLVSQQQNDSPWFKVAPLSTPGTDSLLRCLAIKQCTFKCVVQVGADAAGQAVVQRMKAVDTVKAVVNDVCVQATQGELH